MKEDFMSFVQFADNCTRRLTTERRFRRSPSSFLKFIFSSVNGNTDIFSVFKSALKAVCVTTESAAVRTVYEQLLTKICRTRVKVFLQAMKERDSVHLCTFLCRPLQNNNVKWSISALSGKREPRRLIC